MYQTKKMINFMGLRKLAVIFSVLLILVSIVSLMVKGLELGVDFTGGTEMELSYPEAVEPSDIRDILQKAGYEGFLVQHFGTIDKIRIKMPPQETDSQKDLVTNDAKSDSKAQLSNNILQALQAKTPGVIMDRVEFVGPEVGEELREKGGLALLYALAGILIYVALRFEFRFSVGAIVALMHDVIITLGFFSVTGLEFGLTVLAAILAIIGYSLNDTIVVFDRIRENFRVLRKQEPEAVINISVNNTLARTLVTSLTTLLVLIALFIFGGESVHAFSIAMIVGVLVGTYSSIYVANTSLLMLGVTKESLMPPEKEAEDADELANLP